MRGHEQLIAMRRCGVRPRLVFINIGIDVAEQWRDWHRWTPEYAEVEVGPAEAVNRLDLRFCIGLTVVVTTTDDSKAAAMFDACREAGAKTVIAAALTDTSTPWKTSFTTTTIHDSREVAAA